MFSREARRRNRERLLQAAGIHQQTKDDEAFVAKLDASKNLEKRLDDARRCVYEYSLALHALSDKSASLATALAALSDDAHGDAQQALQELQTHEIKLRRTHAPAALHALQELVGAPLDGAAAGFTKGFDSGVSPVDFVNNAKKQNALIPGIGHRIKSLENPDKRVSIIKEYALQHFPKTPTLNFALAVEQITTQKRSNLILNVDGCIAVCFVDLLRHCGAMSVEEADELIADGCLNGLFVLGRSIGFIGHHLDQKRLKQPLYRHPWDDISYISDDL